MGTRSKKTVRVRKERKQQTSKITVAVKERVLQCRTLSKDGKLVLRMIIKLPNYRSFAMLTEKVMEH